jgi:hypothetical protein
MTMNYQNAKISLNESLLTSDITNKKKTFSNIFTFPLGFILGLATIPLIYLTSNLNMTDKALSLWLNQPKSEFDWN